MYGTDSEDYEALYYAITLTERMEHLFSILDNFDIAKVDAKVLAVAKISHVVRDRETYSDWDAIKKVKGSNSAADNRSVLTGGAYYKTGTHHRVEMSILSGYAMTFSKGTTTSNTSVNQKLFDDLFIDYQGEMSGAGDKADVDLDKQWNIKYSKQWDYGDVLEDEEQLNYRVHVPIDVQTVYPVRTDKGKEPPDPLYARIESEPVINNSIGRGNMSSVRQLIISINVANTNKETDRPIVFFYDGPEKGTINQATGKAITGESVRQSQPVI